MPKKVYDIKPPKLVKKIEKEIKDFLVDEKNHPKQSVKKHKTSQQKKGYPIWLPISIVVFIFIVFLGLYLYFKLPMAIITIWPKVEILSFKQIITADKSATTIDPKAFLIPAEYFEESKTISQDFSATGNASDEGKASGIITVYNKSNISSLREGTRFVSDSGKLFISPSRIILPPPQKSGSKIIPGKVEVKVEAAEGGESYNIAPSEFSLPGLKGTADYYNIYASSDAPMTGGFAGKIKKVTNDDIENAKKEVVKKATEETIELIRKNLPDGYVLLDNATSSEIIESSADVKSGTVAENFKYQATVKVKALVFKKSDLDAFAKNYIATQKPDNKTLLAESYKIDYNIGAVDVSAGKIMLNLEFSTGIYDDINRNSIAMSFMGKNEDQINEVIANSLQDKISRAQVKFWPFWVKVAPKNQKGVKVELKFD